ncbi:HPr kinase/phosphorylase [Brytella acorum]|uniref:HPr kinase/phosphatase C-terminal domain-containing protein n=1 Tax=Brytella acorum TaxID=2959299 RepID=A0AA35UPV0_9PROT|nr:HPr kinase/phosphatase C-terminal domain-containing protein [Brytella acorum]MDF3624973.1 HPr kinase/phosphatase C-terminal domain-containing protein [Brytella acorum]CAI9121456.1 HPr kinase/phosphatase C-terminal domain-containing protein [Brytella acorum]
MIERRTIHASCAALGEEAVILTGAPGSGKSDLLLRLIDAGFDLVADDRIILENGLASVPDSIAGLMEIRGVGIVRLPHRASPVRVRLHVALSSSPDSTRLPTEQRHPESGVVSINLDPRHAGAVAIIRTTLRCLSNCEASCGHELLTGANGDNSASTPFPPVTE